MPAPRAVLATSLLCLVGLAASACGTAPAPSASNPASTPTSAPVSTPVPTPTTSAPASAATPTSPGSPSSPTPSTSVGTPPGGGGPSPSGTSCADLVGSMSLAEQVGQVVMVSQSSTTPSSSGESTIRRLHLGSVVLLGNSTRGRTATASLVRGLRSGVGTVDGVGLLVTADQEGGLVQRLQGPGFDRIPSARTQAGWSDDTLRSRATRWSEQLGEAGIDADLAPVADVVPSSVGAGNAPIGALDRGYGPDPGVVADRTVAVVEGMHAGRTATTAKHFPGLGRVRGNTDTATRVVDATTTRDDALLAGFRADVEHGTDLVMISSATYSRIDADHPGTYSRTVVTDMLRGDLGFRGVVISDDLLGRALSSTSVRSRGVRFLEAGGDLALVGGTDAAAQVYAGLLDEARDSSSFAGRVRESAVRVVALKARQGLARCSA